MTNRTPTYGRELNAAGIGVLVLAVLVCFNMYIAKLATPVPLRPFPEDSTVVYTVTWYAPDGETKLVWDGAINLQHTGAACLFQTAPPAYNAPWYAVSGAYTVTVTPARR